MTFQKPRLCLRCGTVTRDPTAGACATCGNILPEPVSVNKKITEVSPVVHPVAKDKLSKSDSLELLENSAVCLYWLSCACYVLGITLSLMTIKKVAVFFGITFVNESNTVSILSGIWEVLVSGKYFLFVVLFTFSILFPVLKLVLLYNLCCNSSHDKWGKRNLERLELAGRWSMLDVLVVGFLVVIVKLGDLVEVQIHVGFVAFTVSVVLTMITSQLIKRIHEASVASFH